MISFASCTFALLPSGHGRILDLEIVNQPPPTCIKALKEPELCLQRSLVCEKTPSFVDPSMPSVETGVAMWLILGIIKTAKDTLDRELETTIALPPHDNSEHF